MRCFARLALVGVLAFSTACAATAPAARTLSGTTGAVPPAGGTGVPPGTPAPAPSRPAGQVPSGLRVEDGATQPVTTLAAARHERVHVEVPGVDSDADGRPDRVEVTLVRPAGDLEAAAIITASPYLGGGNRVRNHVVDVDRTGRPLKGLRAPLQSPLTASEPDTYLDDYFVPRGYAVLHVRPLGTAGSTGCPTTGGRPEVAGAKAVIDWLNGRARAFREDGSPARATWASGDAGMIGVSWDGTIPNAVAATGVEGLKTIVPIAGISSWYAYYRANGAVTAPGGYQGEDADVMAAFTLTRKNPPAACTRLIERMTRDQDRRTGDYNDFWAERDYLKDAAKVTASVFAVQGLNDWNVRPDQAVSWWQAVRTPRKLWLHQGAHHDPMSFRTAEWVRQLHAWFDHFLYGLDNGITAEPPVDVETAPGRWDTHGAWPPAGVRTLTFRPSGDTLTSGPARPGRARFTDQKARTAEQLVTRLTRRDPNRLAWLTPPLTEPVHLAGTPEVTTGAERAGPSPTLTALLVDLGPGRRPTGELEPTGKERCFEPEVCQYLFRWETANTPWKIVSRGWTDARSGTVRWALQPQDHVFAKGHRIALVLLSTDPEYTLRYPPGTRVTVDLGQTSLRLPVLPDGRS
ncbi:Xaa-Pro dipeptidyl-peptidase [Nonomuraea sp. NPDC050310]|uniref:Xaa-Pro dipeptidyl-peptidase n=1 Tax=Nonomuraea sp. NPDC050310 TaxID=3154935 RepID=UPI0034099065